MLSDSEIDCFIENVSHLLEESRVDKVRLKLISVNYKKLTISSLNKASETLDNELINCQNQLVDLQKYHEYNVNLPVGGKEENVDAILGEAKFELKIKLLEDELNSQVAINRSLTEDNCKVKRDAIELKEECNSLKIVTNSTLKRLSAIRVEVASLCSIQDNLEQLLEKLRCQCHSNDTANQKLAQALTHCLKQLAEKAQLIRSQEEEIIRLRSSVATSIPPKVNDLQVNTLVAKFAGEVSVSFSIPKKAFVCNQLLSKALSSQKHSLESIINDADNKKLEQMCNKLLKSSQDQVNLSEQLLQSQAEVRTLRLAHEDALADSSIRIKCLENVLRERERHCAELETQLAQYQEKERLALFDRLRYADELTQD